MPQTHAKRIVHPYICMYVHICISGETQPLGNYGNWNFIDLPDAPIYRASYVWISQMLMLIAELVCGMW